MNAFIKCLTFCRLRIHIFIVAEFILSSLIHREDIRVTSNLSLFTKVKTGTGTKVQLLSEHDHFQQNCPFIVCYQQTVRKLHFRNYMHHFLICSFFILLRILALGGKGRAEDRLNWEVLRTRPIIPSQLYQLSAVCSQNISYFSVSQFPNLKNKDNSSIYSVELFWEFKGIH